MAKDYSREEIYFFALFGLAFVKIKREARNI